MPPDDPPNTFATPEHVREAIEALSKEDRLRLRKAAAICMAGTEFHDPWEIVHEAVSRTMSAANGDKGRHWPLNVPFMGYMVQTIKGLADDSREALPQKNRQRLDATAAEGAPEEDVLGSLGKFHADCLSEAVEDEDSHDRQSRAKADATLIDDRFADDNEVTLIIMGHKDGLAPSEIRDLGDMTQTQYETARRRLRRGLEKLFPGRRSS